MKALAAAALIAVGVSSDATAKTYRWQCEYPQTASPKGVSEQRFSLGFILDNVTGKAVVVGNAGMNDVDVHVGSYGITLMEKLSTGAVQSTTIADNGKSVHSRHTIPSDRNLIPSQSYGRCTLQVSKLPGE